MILDQTPRADAILLLQRCQRAQQGLSSSSPAAFPGRLSRVACEELRGNAKRIMCSCSCAALAASSTLGALLAGLLQEPLGMQRLRALHGAPRVGGVLAELGRALGMWLPTAPAWWGHGLAGHGGMHQPQDVGLALRRKAGQHPV